MAIQNKCHMRHKPYTKCLQKVDYPSPTHIRPNAKSLSRSIPNTTSQGPHQHLRYLQPKHQNLHDRGGNNVRIGESMSSPTQ
jgi:hypothetical protein